MTGDIWVRRVRLWAGLVLFAYVTTHLINHMLGLVSLEAMERGREPFLAAWRNPIGTALLYGALVAHPALALWGVYKRRSLRLRGWEAAQLLLGLSVPALLAIHIVGTRGAHELLGIEDGYAYVLLAQWVFAPYNAVLQTLAVLAAWIHGCIGLHYWLRLKRWYPHAGPVLYALALLVPVISLLGFATAGREVIALAQDPAWLDAAMARAQVTKAARSADLWPVVYGIWGTVGGAVLLVLGARLLRHWLARRRGYVRLRYPGGRTVEVEPGTSVLEASREAGIPHASVCGGRGRCSTCRVRVGDGAGALPEPSHDEQRVLQRVGAPPNVRLACQLRPDAALEVHPLLPPNAGPRDARTRPGYLAGTEKDIAVLFADLRAFTRFSEQKLPYDVVFVLNRYFHAMGLAVQDAGGHLDKFIGDGVMALFGISGPPADGAQAAIDAASKMAERLQELNEALAHDLDEPLRIGIGIHAGPAIIGEMGYDHATSLTAVGDTVNTASRLEALTKELGAQLVFSEAVSSMAGLRPINAERHEVQLRGRRDRIAVWAVHDAAALETMPQTRSFPSREARGSDAET